MDFYSFTLFIGDLTCNPENNKEECNFDDGDCCRPILHCPVGTNCTSPCHVTKIVHKSFNDEDVECPALKNQPMFGQGKCTDELNTRNCFWDFGECCLPDPDLSDCEECVCHLNYFK